MDVSDHFGSNMVSLDDWNEADGADDWDDDEERW